MTKNELMISLINQYKISRDSNILKRIIDLNKKTIDWYLKNTNINLSPDELYSLIINTIVTSCLNHNGSYTLSYFSLCIRNKIIRKIRISNMEDSRLFENFLEVKMMIEKRFGVTLEKDFSIFDDIVDEMELEGMISYHDKDEIKNRLIKILKNYYGSLCLKTKGYNNYPFEFPSDLDDFWNLINTTIDKDELYYLSSYYGLLDIERKSLNEIGEKNNFSRELIRQINEKSLMKLKGAIEYHINELELPIKIDDIKELLNKILTKEELKYLSQSLGLFGYLERSLTEISEIEGINYDRLWKKINIAKEKIKMALNSYIVLSAFDLSKIRTNLEKLLGLEHFEMTSITYENRKDLGNIIRELDTLDKYMIIKFLKSFLTEIEFYILTSNLGLFDKKKGISELAKEYQASPDTISETLKIAIAKFNTLIIVSESNLDFSKVREFLETLLTKDEFEYLCLSHGLYGNRTMSQKDIGKLKHVSAHVVGDSNIVSADKIKRYLKGIAN